jgi:hypothetical protein
VQPRLETWEQRLDRALLGATGLALTTVELKAKRLDSRDMAADIAATTAFWDMGVITKGAIARFYNLDDLPPELAKEFKSEPAPAPAFGGFGGGLTAMDGGMQAIDAALVAKRWSTEVSELAELRKRIEAAFDRSASPITSLDAAGDADAMTVRVEKERRLRHVVIDRDPVTKRVTGHHEVLSRGA